MSLNVASFPISGPKLNPTRDDYLREAGRLRMAGKTDTAWDFANIYDRLGWSPSNLKAMAEEERRYVL